MEARTVVVAAAIRRDEPPRVLAAQRDYPAALAGRWELPGGKVDPGEDELAALIRECREELGVVIRPLRRAGDDVATVGTDGVLRVWWAELVDGEPHALEHRALRWLTRDELYEVDWLAADLPVVGALAEGLA